MYIYLVPFFFIFHLISKTQDLFGSSLDASERALCASRDCSCALLYLLYRVHYYIIISNVPRYSHITPVPCSLHWVPVKFRFDFKILLLTFKAIYGHAPGYLIDLIAIKEQPRHNLRTASGLILKYPSLNLKKTSGDRAFSSAAPNLWNNLPLHIRLEDNFERFKSLLKTHLFRLAFDM